MTTQGHDQRFIEMVKEVREKEDAALRQTPAWRRHPYLHPSADEMRTLLKSAVRCRAVSRLRAEGGEMKTCVGCKHAAWRRTKADKLHPSGEGRCQYPYKAPPLPISMYWGWGNSKALTPSGGYINRLDEWREDCVYYERKAK